MEEGEKKSKRGKDKKRTKNKKRTTKKGQRKNPRKVTVHSRGASPQALGFSDPFPMSNGASAWKQQLGWVRCPRQGAAGGDTKSSGCSHPTSGNKGKKKSASSPAGSWSSWKEGEVNWASWDEESCWSQAPTPQKLNHSQPFRMSCPTGSPKSCFRARVFPQWVGTWKVSLGCDFSSRKCWFQLFHLPFHPAQKARGCKWLWGQGFPWPDFGPYSPALGWL